MWKRLRWLGCLMVALGMVWFVYKHISAPAVSNKAFLNSQWGMSSAEVEIANATKLEPSQSQKKFFTPKEEIKDPSRYKTLEQSGFQFLGRDATATYVFFDDKLFTYHVFIQDRDEHALDDAVRSYLVQTFGQGYAVVEDESTLKLIWQSREWIVNYWFYQEALTLQEKYTAAYGVVNSTLESAIQE